jgi:hypothetical protein
LSPSSQAELSRPGRRRRKTAEPVNGSALRIREVLALRRPSNPRGNSCRNACADRTRSP